MLLLAASLLVTNPLPLEMPRASAYLVRERGASRLEDRFAKADLWVSQSVDGRWMDDEGRVFVLSHLDVLPPEGPAAEATATRADYAAGRVPVDRREKRSVRTAAAALSPVELAEKETRPRQLPHGFKDVDYWQGTNRSAIVCAYLPEKARTWRLATWQLADGDDFDACLKAFERELFYTDDKAVRALVRGGEEEDVRRAGRRRAAPQSERALLRADARHAVAAYANWHVTEAEEFSVLDALPASRDFVAALTNDLARMRRMYAQALPTHIDGSNALAVARIYADRADYLDALAAAGLSNMTWSAAYWSPVRRELVACLDADGSRTRLVKTLRHEAFHQYLSYATAMIAVSPWLNEGYAAYFENETDDPAGGAWWRTLEAKPTPEDLERYSVMLPALLLMDYEAFYDGTDGERRLKYALAQSVASFLENGAPKVRFRLFKDLKKTYFDELFETRDMHRATQAALGNADLRERFVAEWLRYWKER